MTLLLSVGGLFKIRPEETKRVFQFYLFSFLIGVNLVCFDTAARSLFFTEFKAEALSYVYISSSILIALFGIAYQKLSEHFKIQQTWLTVLVCIGLVQLIGYALLKIYPVKVTVLTVLVSYEVSEVMIQLVFWAFLANAFSSHEGKRLFPFISSGELLGIILTGLSIPFVLEYIDTEELLFVSSSSLVGICLYFKFLTKRFSLIEEKEEEQTDEKLSLKQFGSEKFSRTLLFLAFFSYVAYCFVDYFFYDQLKNEFSDKEKMAAFLGQFLAILALVNLLFKSFISGRLLSRFGLSVCLLILPLVLSFVYVVYQLETYMQVFGSLFVFALIGKSVYRVLWASFEKPCVMILNKANPVNWSNALQLKIESLIEPMASVFVSILLLLAKFEFLTQPVLLILFIGCCLTYLFLCIRVRGFYFTKLMKSFSKRSLSSGNFEVKDPMSIEILKKSFHSAYVGEALYTFQMIDNCENSVKVELLKEALCSNHVQIRSKVYEYCAEYHLHEIQEFLYESLSGEEAEEVIDVALLELSQAKAIDRDFILKYTENKSVLVQISAWASLVLLMEVEGDVTIPENLNKKMNSDTVDDKLFFLKVIQKSKSLLWEVKIKEGLESPNPLIIKQALRTSEVCWTPGLTQYVLNLIYQVEFRKEATNALRYILRYRESLEVYETLKYEFLNQKSNHLNLSRLIPLMGRAPLEKFTNEISFCLNHQYSEIRQKSYRCLYEVSKNGVDANLKNLLRQPILSEHDILDEDLEVLSAFKNKKGFEEVVDFLNHKTKGTIRRIFIQCAALFPEEQLFTLEKKFFHHDKMVQQESLNVLESILKTISKKNLISSFERWQSISSSGIDIKKVREITEVRIVEDYFDENSPYHSSELLACMIHNIELMKIEGVHQKEFWLKLFLHREKIVRQSAYKKYLEMYNISELKQCIKEFDCHKNDLEYINTYIDSDKQQFVFSLLEKILILGSVEVLRDAPKEILTELAEVSEELHLDANHLVFNDGDRGSDMYVIANGEVKIQRGDEQIALLGDREVFGEMAALDPEPRMASATTTKETVLFKISQHTLLDLIDDAPIVSMGIIKVLCQRIRKR